MINRDLNLAWTSWQEMRDGFLERSHKQITNSEKKESPDGQDHTKSLGALNFKQLTFKRTECCVGSMAVFHWAGHREGGTSSSGWWPIDNDQRTRGELRAQQQEGASKGLRASPPFPHKRSQIPNYTCVIPNAVFYETTMNWESVRNTRFCFFIIYVDKFGNHFWKSLIVKSRRGRASL